MTMQLNQLSIVEAILVEIVKQYPESEASLRQFNAVVDAANSIVKEFSAADTFAVAGSGIDAWRKTDSVGKSSDFMAATLGGAGVRAYAHPHDPADFGRCVSLLEAAPELRSKLPKMAAQSKVWARLVGAWEELEALWDEESPSGAAPKLYKRMKEVMCTPF